MTEDAIYDIRQQESVSVTEEKQVEAVKAAMATIISAQKILQALAPEYNWRGMGNVIGDFGEFIATRHYGLEKAPSGTKDYDAVTKDGKTVQIKTNFAASSIGFRGEADLMLVIGIKSNGDWEELYFGDFKKVKEIASYGKRDNKYGLTVSKLKKI